MIFRTVKNATNPYFLLSRIAINDERLSYKAIGIHTTLMGKPDHWEANEVDLTNRHPDGKAAVRSGVQELLQYGYMARVQIRKDNKIVGWRLDTYESPELNPHYREGEPVGYVIEELDSENRNVADLDSDFQDVEKQDVGNRNHSNYRKEESNEGEKAPPSPLHLNGVGKRQRPKKTFIYHDDWRADYAPLFERLADVYRTRPLIDEVQDDKAIGALQRITIDMVKLGVTTVEAINDLEKKWYAEDFRGKKSESPHGRQFVEFAAAQKSSKSTNSGTSYRKLKVLG